MTDRTAEKTGCPRWFKIALIASLALNVIVVGLIAGHTMRSERSANGPGKQVDWIIRLVPEERREFTRAHFEPLKDVLAVQRMNRLEYLDQIVEAIRSEPFLPDRLSAALAMRRESSSKRREIVQDGLVELLGKFSAGEREMFADGIQDQVQKLKEARFEQARN
jgi:uncharacterized membrane protein